MKKKEKLGRKLLSFLLTLALVLGLMPGMSMTAQAATAYTSGQIRISDMANGDIIRGTCTIYQNPNRALEIYDTDGTTLLQQYNNGSSRTLSALGYDTIVTKTGVGSGDYNNRLVKLQKLSPSPTVTSVTLDKNELSLDAGGATAELIATVEANYDAIKGVTWSSSDSTVATVNSNGVITPVGAGDPVTIKATSTWDNTKYAECVVTVNASHTHSFTYAVDDATITATCTADGCTLPESSAGVGDHVATLTISANGGTYDGTTAYGATITDDNSIQGDAKVQYQKKSGESYGTATETAPTDAGDYKASITVGGVTASVEYTIARADPTANAPTGLTATYGQTLADVSLEGKNPEGNTPGTWTWADSTQSVGDVVTPAATFKATFTPNSSNYKTVENVDVSVTVNKAANPATVTSTATVTKGGNTVDLASNVTLNGATGTVNYEISGEANGCILNGSTLTSGNNTGSVTVNVTVATDSNYEALAATPITVTVSDKGTQTITAEDVTVTYGDTGKSVSASVTDPTTGGGAISYAVKDGSGDYIDVDAASGALTIKKVPADGKAYVTVTAVETATYAQATKDVTVTINKANAVAATVTANNRTYDGTAQPLVTVTGEATGGEMQYALGTKDAATQPYTTDIPTGTDAGTYYVWYKVVGDENHNDTDAANVPVVIAKADSDYTVPTGLTAVYGDTLQDVTLPAGWTWADADQIVGDAGTNTFKANYVPNDVTNYNAVENVDVTVSVSKGNGAAAVAPEVTAWTSDYVSAEAVNGQEYVIVKKGETPDWSKAVTPDKGSVTFTGLTPATEYSIYTRVKETDNTLASEPEKVDVMTSLIGWETRGEAKTGETITIIPDPENAEGLTWQWYYAEEDNEENVVKGEAIPGATGSSYVVKDSDLGKYLYYVISKGGEELAEGYAGPVKININVTVALEGWVYGGNPNTPKVSGNTGNGAVTFTYVVKGAEEPESETVPTLPGTYTVFAYVEESGDYAFGYAEADFTIAKGTPAVTAPKARNLVYTGASQELVEAGVAVGGEMQYALGTDAATAPSDNLYTIDVPTATDAGTYYVWYKVVGDENHNDSTPVCVPVVIESKESVEGEVTFNKGEDDAETPETVVDSVESSDLTEFAETQKEESKEVKVELEITPKKEADIVQTSADETKQIAEGLFVGFDADQVATEYFEIDIKKYVNNEDAGIISDTKNPLEITLTYDKTKMFDPVVVRTHNGETKVFEKLSARPAEKADYKDATYYVGDGMIYLYSQFFSDYAIIYSTVKTYNVVIVTGTSDKISKTVAEGSKVDLPTGLSKSGYTFSGWYSDEAYTKVWNANDPVTADTTIYAKWTKNTVPYVPSTPVETPTPTPTATPTPTETPTVTPAPVKDSITAEEAARGAIKLNAGLKVYPKKSDVVVKWGKVDNADRYVIYAAYCKKGRKCAKIATLDGDVNSYKFSELNGKAINTKKNIKLYVVAYRKVNGKYKKITRSITAHIVGSGSKKYSNVKGINVESTKITLSLDDNSAAPSSYTLNPVAVLKDSSKKMLLHTAEFRYATSKSSVATVGKDGTITAKGIGTCYIYVYAQNGYAKKVKVIVK